MKANSKELYQKLIDQCDGIELKGKSLPYTSLNGHMFSQLNKEGNLGIRFSEDRQKQLIQELNTRPFRSYGAELKGYVLMPKELWNNIDRLAEYLIESHQYVSTIKPKS